MNLNGPITDIVTQDQQARWSDARLGRFTASTFSEIVCAKGKPTDTMLTRCRKVAAERITGMEAYSAQTKAMEWGQDMEVHAFELLSELWTPLEAATFVPFGLIAGCTPDAYAQLHKISTVDIKNPFNTDNYLHWLSIGDTWEDLKAMGKEGAKYAWQIAAQARFCGYELCSLAYVDGRIPDPKRRAKWRTYELTEEMVETIDTSLEAAEVECQRFMALMS